MLNSSRRFISFLVMGLLLQFAHAQLPAKPEFKRDYSKEAFVIEQTFTHIAFENDGTGKRDASARIRIQSDAGVQHYGLLTFSYENSTESMDVDYVRVLKADGSMVPTPSQNTQDMAAQITREAPFYSDLREKHIAVKGLGVGDVLEFHVQWNNTKPLAPGQFWYAYNFSHDGIILQEQLQIKLPRDRAVKWKSPAAKPAITEDGSQRVFTWTSSELEHKSSEQEKADQETKLYQAARGQLPNADVQVSSFQSWEDVGRWYGGLQQERVKPTPEIRAKAAELTKGAADDNAKLRAIYKYVSMDFRYIGIAFGIGRYQPHSAAEVLSNQYGDCKDKHTLLASLLDAAGIKAYPALISTTHDVDLDLPSPGQFDHVISLVPQANGFLWLDTTAEVAPFGYLLSPLRDKHALAIPDDKPPTLMTTPPEPPSKALQTFKIEGKLSDTGTLEGKVERTLQGDDGEVLVRSAFRRVPMPQWKDLIQQISYGSGFAGDVSEVTAGPPEKIDEPFHFAYNYTRKDFPNWSGREVSSPLPPMLGLASDVKPSHPILLGAIGRFQYDSRVELPKGYSPTLPHNVDLKEDFAEYHAAYSAKDGVLITERTFDLKMREVPLTEYEAFKKFAQAVSDDHERYVALSSGNAPVNSKPNSLQTEIMRLPGSDNLDAERAYDDGVAAGQANDLPGAVDSLKRAVEADPHFTRAQMMLVQLYMVTGQRDLGLETLRAAHHADPTQPVLCKALAGTLTEMRRFEDAIPVWQELIKVEPDNVDAIAALGNAFYNLKRYAEAASTAESAIKIAPDRPGLFAQVGYAYLHAGNDEQALAAFKKALQIAPEPLWFNNFGYELAVVNRQLPLALEYAEKAVRDEETATAKVQLSDLKDRDLDYTLSLSAYWDTLGWVYFRMGNLDQAEKYLNAAWTLAQNPDQADHLGQLYEKKNQKEAAAKMYRLALAATPERLRRSDPTEEIRTRLEHLRPGAIQSQNNIDFQEGSELNQMRTVKLARITPETASAEFFLIFGPGPKVEDIKFIRGSDKLQSAGDLLKSASFKVRFPDDTHARLLRRGILSCSPVSGCSFVFQLPDSIRSVK